MYDVTSTHLISKSDGISHDRWSPLLTTKSNQRQQEGAHVDTRTNSVINLFSEKEKKKQGRD